MVEKFFNLFMYSRLCTQSMDYTMDFQNCTLLCDIVHDGKTYKKDTQFMDVFVYLGGTSNGSFHFINWREPSDNDQGIVKPDDDSFLIENKELMSHNRW